MKIFYFSCGDIKNYKVEAEKWSHVFPIAIRENPQSQFLGVLFEVREEGQSEDDWIYSLTMKGLEEYGFSKPENDLDAEFIDES